MALRENKVGLRRSSMLLTYSRSAVVDLSRGWIRGCGRCKPDRRLPDPVAVDYAHHNGMLTANPKLQLASQFQQK